MLPKLSDTVLGEDSSASTPTPAPASVKGAVQVKLTIPTKSQVAVFVAEAGALLVFVNDFVKFDKITGWPLAGLNAASSIIAAVSHWNNKRKAATQASAD